MSEPTLQPDDVARDYFKTLSDVPVEVRREAERLGFVHRSDVRKKVSFRERLQYAKISFGNYKHGLAKRYKNAKKTFDDKKYSITYGFRHPNPKHAKPHGIKKWYKEHTDKAFRDVVKPERYPTVKTRYRRLTDKSFKADREPISVKARRAHAEYVNRPKKVAVEQAPAEVVPLRKPGALQTGSKSIPSVHDHLSGGETPSANRPHHRRWRFRRGLTSVAGPLSSTGTHQALQDAAAKGVQPPRRVL